MSRLPGSSTQIGETSGSGGASGGSNPLIGTIGTSALADGSVTDAKISSTGVLGAKVRVTRAVNSTGVAATDTAAIQAAMDAMSPVGGIVQLGPGDFAVNATLEVPSNVTVRGAGRSRTRVVSSITPISNPNNATFHAAASAASATTTLASDNTLGARTISVAASVAAGSIITVNDTTSGAGLRTMSYDVQSVSGSGPYTLTLDRPVLVQYATGDTVGVHATQPTNIILEDFSIEGSADRFIELVTAKDCVVRRVRMKVTAGASHDIMGSFDVGNRGCRWEDVEADGGGIASDCLALEGSEQGRVVNCRTRSSLAYGIVLHDAIHGVMEDCHSSNHAFGWVITADGTTKGSIGTRIRGGSSMNNTTEGLSVINGSTDTVVEGADLRFNPKAVTASSDAADVTLSKCNLSRHTTNAASIGTGATGVRLRDSNLTGSATTVAVVAAGDIDIEGCRTTSCQQFAVLTGKALLQKNYVKCTSATPQHIIYLSSSTPRVSLAQCEIESASTNSNLVSIAAGACTITQTTLKQVDGATGCLGMYISGGSLSIGSGVDPSGCGTPLSSAGGTTKLVTETTVTSMSSPS